MTQHPLEHGVVVLTAPSGAGKTTIAHRLIEAYPELQFTVSATTRPPRANEQHGVDYYFVSLQKFESLIKEDRFLEYEEVYTGRFYGTLLSEIERLDASGPMLLDLDVKGAERVKALYGDRALVLFIMPPSMDILKNRLQSRGTESSDWLKDRIQRASMEMSYAASFDVTILNDQLERAVEETISHVTSFLDSVQNFS